jgi:hypothetical protein
MTGRQQALHRWSNDTVEMCLRILRRKELGMALIQSPRKKEFLVQSTAGTCEQEVLKSGFWIPGHQFLDVVLSFG